MPWDNADGLRVFFAGESRSVDGGEYPGAGANRTIEVEVNGVGLSTTAGTPTLVGKPWIIIPRNSVIESVEVIAETAFTSGGAATLNVGLQRFNGTELDHDGLVAAMALTSLDRTGEKTVLTSSTTAPAGALIGTETQYPAYIDVYAGTAAFTAGRAVIRVNIYVKDEDTLVNNW